MIAIAISVFIKVIYGWVNNAFYLCIIIKVNFKHLRCKNVKFKIRKINLLF